MHKPLFENPNNYQGVWNDPDYDEDFEDTVEVWVALDDEGMALEEGDEMAQEIDGELACHVVAELLGMHGLAIFFQLLCIGGEQVDFAKRCIPAAALVQAVRMQALNRQPYIPGNRRGVWVRLSDTPRRGFCRLPAFQASVQAAPRVMKAPVAMQSSSVAKRAVSSGIGSHPYFLKMPAYKPSWA